MYYKDHLQYVYDMSNYMHIKNLNITSVFTKAKKQLQTFAKNCHSHAKELVSLNLSFAFLEEGRQPAAGVVPLADFAEACFQKTLIQSEVCALTQW